VITFVASAGDRCARRGGDAVSPAAAPAAVLADARADS
jgi:hypothetical protein